MTSNSSLNSTLLPLNAKPIEKAVDALNAQSLDVDVTPVDTNPLTCPSQLLPYLAAMWRVTIDQLSEQEQRQLIHNALAIHKYKGTVYAVQKALDSVLNRVSINENKSAFEFDVVVTLKSDPTAVYNNEKFNTARQLTNNAKNARSRFINFELNFPNADCSIEKTDASIVNTKLNTQLNLNATASVAVQGAIQWTL